METAATEEVPDYMNELGLRGRGFIVFGAGRGIGAQCSHALAQAGAKLLLVDSHPASAEAIARATGGSPVVLDASKRDDMNRIIEIADEEFADGFAGTVDIIGMASIGPLAGMEEDVWDRQFDVNVRHAYYLLRTAAPKLARLGRGSMTFVGSIAGLVPNVNQAAYGASKAALHHLVQVAAQEFGVQGVRVNAVAPGFVRTRRLESYLSAKDWQDIEGSNALGRAAKPADIARAVLFLASDLAQYINGNILRLDGGGGNTSPVPLKKRPR